MRLLLVDDDPDTCALLAMYFSRHGMDVLTVGTYADAREALRRERFDALLTDVELPDGNGRMLLAEGRPAGLRTAVVVSGHSGPEEREASVRAGFDAHWVKPVNGRALFDLLVSPSGEASR